MLTSTLTLTRQYCLPSRNKVLLVNIWNIFKLVLLSGKKFNLTVNISTKRRRFSILTVSTKKRRRSRFRWTAAWLWPSRTKPSPNSRLCSKVCQRIFIDGAWKCDVRFAWMLISLVFAFSILYRSGYLMNINKIKNCANLEFICIINP